MKKSKKLAALVLALVMAFSLMAVTAAAYGAEKSVMRTGVPLRRRSGICKRTRLSISNLLCKMPAFRSWTPR